MAQSQTRNGAASSDDLERQIAALKTDIAAITNTLTEMGAARRDAAVDKVRSGAGELRVRGEAAAADIHRRGADLGDQAIEAVRERPATAVGLAVGLGFLVGLMTGRR